MSKYSCENRGNGWTVVQERHSILTFEEASEACVIKNKWLKEKGEALYKSLPSSLFYVPALTIYRASTIGLDTFILRTFTEIKMQDTLYFLQNKKTGDKSHLLVTDEQKEFFAFRNYSETLLFVNFNVKKYIAFRQRFKQLLDSL